MGTTSQTKITVTCDNPKCDAVVEWVAEEVEQNEEAVPEAFFRILKLTRSYIDPASGEKLNLCFCSAHCLIKWLQSCYKPSISPREKTRQMQGNKDISKAESACKATGVIDTIPPPLPEGIILSPPHFLQGEEKIVRAEEVDKKAVNVVPAPIPEGMVLFPPYPLAPKQAEDAAAMQADNVTPLESIENENINPS
jgi:hypothetical protein